MVVAAAALLLFFFRFLTADRITSASPPFVDIAFSQQRGKRMASSSERKTVLEEARLQTAAGVANSKNNPLKTILGEEHFYASGSLLMSWYHRAQGRTPPPLHFEGVIAENTTSEDLLKMAGENPELRRHIEDQLRADKKNLL